MIKWVGNYQWTRFLLCFAVVCLCTLGMTASLRILSEGKPGAEMQSLTFPVALGHCHKSLPPFISGICLLNSISTCRWAVKHFSHVLTRFLLRTLQRGNPQLWQPELERVQGMGELSRFQTAQEMLWQSLHKAWNFTGIIWILSSEGEVRFLSLGRGDVFTELSI